MRMLEWVTIIFAVLMEALTVTWPDRELRNRIPILKRRSTGTFILVAVMLALSVAYLAFSFVWVSSDIMPLRICGGLILAMSFLPLLETHTFGKRHPFSKRLEAAVNFTCLIMVGYMRLKGW
jgi:hypothetical protein